MTIAENTAAAPARAVWIIDSDELKRAQMQTALVRHGYLVHGFEDVTSALTSTAIAERLIVIIADRLANGCFVEGLDDLNDMQEIALTIVTSSAGSIDGAVDAFRHGAQDYLLEPYSSFELDDVIQRALEKANKQDEIAA